MLRSILLAAVAVLLVPAGASAAPGWGDAETVATTPSPSELGALVTPAGEVLATYESDDRVKVVRRLVGGGFETLLDEPGWGLQLHADAAGAVTAVWEPEDADALKLATRPPGGTFTAQDVGDDTGLSSSDVAGDGSAIVGWRAGNVLKVALREGHGPFFVEEIAGGTINTPLVAVGNGGRAIVTWTDGQSRGRYRLRGAHGGFGEVGVLETPDHNLIYVRPAMNDAGHVQVTWWNSGAREAHAGPADTALSAPVRISPQPPQGQTSVGFNAPIPAVAPNGEAFVLWSRHPTTQADPVGTSYLEGARRPAGEPFLGHLDVAPPARDRNFSPQAVAYAADDSLLVGWRTHMRADNARSLNAAVAAPGHPLVAHELRPFSLAEVGGVALAGDANGNVAAVWDDGSGATDRVVMTGLDGDAPTVRASGSRTITAGEPASFSAQATDVWSPVSLTWQLGDGSAAVGATVDHRYAAAGARTAVVTATDAAGNAATASVPVEVRPRPVRVDAAGADAAGGEDADGAVGAAEGEPAAAAAATRAAAAPLLARLKVAGRRATFSLSAAIGVTLTVERSAPGRRATGGCAKPARANRTGAVCALWTRVGKAIVVAGRSGENRATLPKLAPGSYRVVATAGRTRTVSAFTVAAPRKG